MASRGSKKLLFELEELADRLGIKIRYEKTDARGGMCYYKGIPLIIIDRNAAYDYKISVIINNLRKFNIADKYISPKLREILESY